MQVQAKLRSEMKESRAKAYVYESNDNVYHSLQDKPLDTIIERDNNKIIIQNMDTPSTSSRKLRDGKDRSIIPNSESEDEKNYFNDSLNGEIDNIENGFRQKQ